MNRTNLIPLSRQFRDHRLTRLRQWAWVTGASICLVAGTIACCAAGGSQSGGPPPEEFSKASAELSKTNQEGSKLRAEVALERERLRSRRLIFQQPDYSLLLRLIAQQVDEDVVLTHCEFGRPTTSGVAAEPAPSSSDVLQLSGFARSQPVVAAFMLQLEATGIFQKVTLLRSNEQPLLSGRVAAFEIRCVPGPVSKEGQ